MQLADTLVRGATAPVRIGLSAGGLGLSVWSPAPEVRGPGDPLVPVEAPWEGYDEMTPAEIRKRLAIVDRVDAASVSLYEGVGRKRSSIVDAAARRMPGSDAWLPNQAALARRFTEAELSSAVKTRHER